MLVQKYQVGLPVFF